MAKYIVRSEVIRYPGMDALFFAYVDKKLAAEIKERHGKVKRGFGSIKVTATIGKTTWRTSIFPDKRSGGYVLPLKAAVRTAEGIGDGDKITFKLDI